jgi:acyl dehydratase
MRAVAGEQFGIGQWYQIGQSQITAFADATEDHQWIHVDPERAAQGPSRTAS